MRQGRGRHSYLELGGVGQVLLLHSAKAVCKRAARRGVGTAQSKQVLSQGHATARRVHAPPAAGRKRAQGILPCEACAVPSRWLCPAELHPLAMPRAHRTGPGS